MAGYRRNPKWNVLNWKNTDAGFVSFAGGRESFRIEDEAGPYLNYLIETFPKEFSRALRNVGYELRKAIVGAIRAGRLPTGQELPAISRMHMYRRMELLKAGKGTDTGWENGRRFSLKKKLGHSKLKGSERMMERWKGRVSEGRIRAKPPMCGKFSQTVRYKMVNPTRVDIGALNAGAAKWLEAVQAGKRGSKGIFQFLGEQPITPAMRRAFWAAGVPLGKNKRTIQQVERSVVAPVYGLFAPKLSEILEARIKLILAGKTGRPS